MKAFFRAACFALLLALAPGAALALPMLSDVFGSDAALTPGWDGWYVDFNATEGGTLALRLLSGETGEAVADLGATQIEAGNGRVHWNGLLPDGTPCAPGAYMVELRVKNYWGEESAQSLLSLAVLADGQSTPETAEQGALTAQATDNAPVASAASETAAVPQATSFWDMDPDAYDLKNPEHQRAIWELMMLPITVLDVGQTEHVYPTNQPGIDRKPYKDNTAGELHGQSQGVHVLEDDADGDGYVLIESYSNDGTKTENSFMESIDAKRIQGYVKKSLLFTVTPSDKYALLVDKLRQTLYIFEEGRIIGELAVSTGLNNENQPYNETPAGEFITVSKVGLFVSGSMRADYAIRINGGTLLHEVPYRFGADGTTKMYAEFEDELGQKASHGCIRIQRRKNEQGQNMAWLWDNLEMQTKVFVWDDQGRTMYDPDVPDPATPLYRNPDGGSNYHVDQNCSGVRDKFLPLTGDFTYGDLESDAFKKLTPCPYCGAPDRLADIAERYLAAAEQIGAEVPQSAREKLGI